MVSHSRSQRYDRSTALQPDGHQPTASLGCMAEYVHVTTATETQDQALALAKAITEKKLAASAQITGPVTATFWHLGQFGQAEEWSITLKTTRDRYEELETYLRENHPWNNPEIAAIPITAGAPDYLGWIARTTARDSD